MELDEKALKTDEKVLKSMKNQRKSMKKHENKYGRNQRPSLGERLSSSGG